MPTQEMPMFYVNRTEWGAQESVNELPAIEHPVKYIRLTFTEGGKKCGTNKKCTKRLKELQEHDMKELNLPDLEAKYVYVFILLFDSNFFYFQLPLRIKINIHRCITRNETQSGACNTIINIITNIKKALGPVPSPVEPTMCN